jgi:hypothetical protein
MGLRSRLRPLVASCSFCLLLLILLTDEEPLLPSQPLGQAVNEDGPPPVEAEDVEAEVGCPRNKPKKISVRTETNRNTICFGFVSVCFVKPKTKNFGLFPFVSVFRTFIETTETNRTVSKPTETTLNFQKKYQNMLSLKLFRLVFCLFWFNRNTATLCFGIEPKQPKQTFCFG